MEYLAPEPADEAPTKLKGKWGKAAKKVKLGATGENNSVSSIYSSVCLVVMMNMWNTLDDRVVSDLITKHLKQKVIQKELWR